MTSSPTTPTPSSTWPTSDSEAETALLAEIRVLTNTIRDVQAVAVGDLGVTVTVFDSTGTTDAGEDFATTMRETMVWTRGDDGWRVIHEHTSPVPVADQDGTGTLAGPSAP